MTRCRRGKVNATGRNKNAKHVRLYAKMMDSAAYRSLSPVARAVHLEVQLRHNGSNNGKIPLSCREAAKLVNVSKDSAAQAFKMLQDRGFLKIGTPSAFNVKTRQATRWILTDQRLDEHLPRTTGATGSRKEI